MKSIFIMLFVICIIGVGGISHIFAESSVVCQITDVSKRDGVCTAEISSNPYATGYVGILGPSCSEGKVESNTAGDRLFIGPRAFDYSVSQAGCYRSWITWDLSDIPKDSQILNTEIKFHKLPPSHSLHTGNVHALIFSLENNPEILSVPEIRDDIRDGTLYVEQAPHFSFDGIHRLDLGIKADADITHALSDGQKIFGIGLSAFNEDTSSWNLSEIGKDVKLILTYKPSTHEIKDNLLDKKQTTVIDDDFSNGMNGWEYSSFPSSYAEPKDGYSAKIITKGDEKFILISGDGYAIHSGIKKTIQIPQYVDGNFLFSFKGNTIAKGYSHSFPNLLMTINDSNGNLVHSENLVLGGPYSTEWKYYQKDISEFVKNNKEITIFLGLSDSWQINYNQQLEIDDIQLTVIEDRSKKNTPDVEPEKNEFSKENKKLQQEITILQKENQKLRTEIILLQQEISQLKEVVLEQIRVMINALNLSKTDDVKTKQNESQETTKVSVDHKTWCENNNGMWLEEFEECELIGSELCLEQGGAYDECASACRNDPFTLGMICTANCVQVCSFSDEEIPSTYNLITSKDEFNIEYEIEGGDLSKIIFDEEATMLLIQIDSYDDGTLFITLPKELIDSHNSIPPIYFSFIILVDGKEFSDYNEIKNFDDRRLIIPFEDGIKEIEIFSPDEMMLFDWQVKHVKDSKGYSKSIFYNIENGVVNSIEMNYEFYSLFVNLELDSNTNLQLMIPRTVIDAKTGQQDDSFIILADGIQLEFLEQRTINHSILDLELPENTTNLEIIGTFTS